VGHLRGIEFDKAREVRVPTLLVTEPGSYGEVAIAGEWLVYTRQSEPGKEDWQLYSMPLEAAFEQLPEKTTDAVWTLLLQKQKPLDLATLQEQTSVVGSGTGIATVYANIWLGGLGTAKSVDLSAVTYEDGWYSIPVTWGTMSVYARPVIVRGRQLDGDGEVRFGSGPAPEAQLFLAIIPTYEGIAHQGISHQVPNMWASVLRVKGPGSYALQIDNMETSEVIHFEAIED
jgi:hypothetical protein